MPDQPRQPIANIERLKEHMAAEGIGAIVARSGKNFSYLSGVAFPGTLARHLDLPDSPRDVFCVWPLEGEPAVISNALGVPVIERDSWIANVVVVQDYVESPRTKLASVLKEMGLANARIGMEASYVNAARWAEIESLLPDAQFVDCTSLMNSVRWIKTPAEIALLKESADIQDDAHLEVFPTIQPGDRERDVHARFLRSHIERGCHFVHGVLTSHRNTSMYLGESDLVIEAGDIIRTDYVSYLNGYPGHQSRMAVVGQPTSEQARKYADYRDIYLKLIEKCTIGTKVSELYFYGREMLLAKGFPHNPASFVGHSVGSWWHQQEPFLVKGWEVEIAENMVLAIEPYVDYWHIQDMVHITQDGPRLLSDRFDTSTLFVTQ